MAQEDIIKVQFEIFLKLNDSSNLSISLSPDSYVNGSKNYVVGLVVFLTIIKRVRRFFCETCLTTVTPPMCGSPLSSHFLYSAMGPPDSHKMSKFMRNWDFSRRKSRFVFEMDAL